MKVLLIGAGGREHALAWKLAASPMLTKLHAAPGNPGIAREAECHPIAMNDHAGIVGFCEKEAIDLVVVGPEAPLVAGLADELRAAGVKVFGPSAAAAWLEGSKGFTKDLCARFGIPTAAYGKFDGRRVRRSSSKRTDWPPARASPSPRSSRKRWQRSTPSSTARPPTRRSSSRSSSKARR